MATVEPNYMNDRMCEPQSLGKKCRQPPRLVPDAELPTYSYVTGRYPHPTRDPGGHSHGHELRANAIDSQNWRHSRQYLLGCELFNHGYYWEAHEAWEAVWQACGRRGDVADFLKGLIKLAAAGVKVREGRPTGVARLGARAGALFRRVRKEVREERFLGLETAALIGFADRLTRLPNLPYNQDAAVEIVFSKTLVPLD